MDLLRIIGSRLRTQALVIYAKEHYRGYKVEIHAPRSTNLDILWYSQIHRLEEAPALRCYIQGHLYSESQIDQTLKNCLPCPGRHWRCRRCNRTLYYGRWLFHLSHISTQFYHEGLQQDVPCSYSRWNSVLEKTESKTSGESREPKQGPIKVRQFLPKTAFIESWNQDIYLE